MELTNDTGTNAFASARAAMEADLSTQESQAPEQSEEIEAQADELETDEAPEATKEDTQKKSVSQVVLDKLEKFVFNGKEMTPEQLKKAVLMHKDYTQKTQKLAEERKTYESERTYIDNLKYDLKRIAQSPDLVDQFKSIYPEKYHDLADLYAGRASKTQEPQPQKSKLFEDDKMNTVMAAVLKHINSKLDERLAPIESEKKEAEIAKEEATLNRTIDSMTAKYPDADADLVLAKADAYIAKGIKMTEANWEKLFKSEHERFNKRFSERQKKLVEKTKESFKHSRDSGRGGSAPTSVKSPRNIREATELAIKDLTRRGK